MLRNYFFKNFILKKFIIFGPVILLCVLVLFYVIFFSFQIPVRDFSVPILDEYHYFLISKSGYTALLNFISFAYFPAWPVLNSFFSSIWFSRFLSFGLISFFCSIISKLNCYENINFLYPFAVDEKRTNRILPQIFFLFVPTSWVYLSNHTESLFLLCSWLAFYFGYRKKYFLCGLFAAACVMTRNQGVFVMAGSTLCVFVNRDHVANILKTLLPGLLVYFAWLAYQYFMTGDAFRSFHVQHFWFTDTGPFKFLKNFYWVGRSNWVRFLFLYLHMLVAVNLVIKDRRFLPLGVFVFGCVLSSMLQTNSFPNAYRYCLPCFPTYFYFSRLVIKKNFFGKFVTCALILLWFVNILELYKPDGWPY